MPKQRLSSSLSSDQHLRVVDSCWCSTTLWQADVWEDLLQAPLERAGAFHSRVLITTRNEDVARSMRVIHTHRVDKLPADDGWELLSKSVFGDEAGEDKQDLQEVGVKIVEKCDGLPLAIKAIAGILRTKDGSKREWENVCKSHAWNVRGELPEAVRGALYLSYEDLPSHLKQCFLYCSLFPEDYSFFRLDLVRWWVAEGFITPQGDDSLLEDIAEDCYNDLISRNLLNYDPKYLDGSQCVMHDLIRSIALSLTRNESHIVDGAELTAVNSLKLRRLSLRAKEPEVILNAVHTPLCLRTLHMVRCSKIEMRDLSQRFKRLRVLSLSDSMIENIPESISNLQHLRFLDLDHTNICALPESLGSLTNLQFLQLSGCKSLQSLPKTITQLSNLRRLGFYRAPVTHVPVGIGKLNHLVDLEGFVVGLNDAGDSHRSGKDQLGCGLDELQPMTQLRNLSILRLDRILIGGIQPLKDKPFLKRLRLEWNEEVGQSLSSERTQQVCEDLAPPPSLEILFMSFFNGVRFPQWISMLPNLTHLSIYSFFSCRELPSLGQLPQLKILRIEDAPAIVTIGPEFLGCDRKHTAFPRLEQLVLIALPNLEKWTLCDANEGDGGKITTIKLLPCLQKLQIFFCPKLRALPEGLQQAAALKDCCIHGADSLTEIENIPSVEILTVRECPCLESISNLPALREMTIAHSSRILKAVEKMGGLQSLSLYLEDAFTECLPEWLLRLIPLLELETLSLYCNVALMEKCREGGEYWSLLGNIADFSVRHNI
ncbi:uncharacterized protein A4U43_C03F2050 [Asparagus officinalis]|uniref:Uncharacterized protein n=1 Tax=Asparagus officinalis TaxID=4686 RepID=A0A5P1F6P3_ASPOF|nr:uncharacterized protein A4U43_C03F2050 [Asparagus officinalis]